MKKISRFWGNGDTPFKNCPNLRDVYMGSKTPIPMSVSSGKPNDFVVLHVPTGSKALYEEANYWKEFDIVEDEVLGINDMKSGNKHVSKAYDLQGRRANNGQKGIVVKNRQKYVVK